MPFNLILTSRLVLRAPAASDLAAFLAYRNHPDNLALQPLDPMPEADAMAFLQRQAALDLDAGPCWMMCVLERRDDGRVVGEVGAWLAPAAQRTADIGWSLHPDYHGQGYATEGARALLDFLFTVRSLHRVTATCDQRNVASTRLMERLGMRREGDLRQSQLSRGAWRDEYQYALLRAEWPGQAAPLSAS